MLSVCVAKLVLIVTRVTWLIKVGWGGSHPWVLLLTYLRTNCMKQSPSSEGNRFSAGQEIPRILWNPEGSLSHSQVPATCPCPEPARSSPYAYIPLPENPSEYYPPIYAWVFPVVSFPQVSPPKRFIRLSSPPYVLHAPPISFSSI